MPLAVRLFQRVSPSISLPPYGQRSCVGNNLGGWSDAGTCEFGYADNVTFDFSSQDLVLPSQVIYGISYPTTGNAGSLNVGLSDDTSVANTSDVTVGSDAVTGDFLDSTEPNAYCNDTLTPGSFQYDPYTLPCTGIYAVDNPAPGQSGTWAVDYQPGFWVPAVQLNAAGQGISALYPGASPLPVDFTVTNPGNSPVTISKVSVSITNIGGGNDAVGGLTGDCPATWFSLIQPTAPSNISIGAGQTLTFSPSGGSLQLINESGNQDAVRCHGDSRLHVELTATSRWCNSFATTSTRSEAGPRGIGPAAQPPGRHSRLSDRLAKTAVRVKTALVLDRCRFLHHPGTH